MQPSKQDIRSQAQAKWSLYVCNMIVNVVCGWGYQWSRLSSSRNTGCVREETLNCECLPSALSVSVGSSTSHCCPPFIVILNHYSLRSVLLNQARPESTTLTSPKRHCSTLNSNTPALRTNTLSCLAVSMFLFHSLSFLSGSNISTTLVPIHCRHSTAKHETEAWELKISPVITKMDFEILLCPFLFPILSSS